MLGSARWSTWRPFPDPRRQQLLVAPIGPGVYELRNAQTGELILCGIGAHCAKRMTSLLPKPLGAGGRRNDRKRGYVQRHLSVVEYRFLPCSTRADARLVEKDLLGENCYRFNS